MAEVIWESLDEAWREAFRQAWLAFRGGNCAVGACATTPDGVIVHTARNRIEDQSGPAGEVFGSMLAHAEINVLARIPAGHPRNLVLTTTLVPCIQCSAAIRLGPVATVRFAGTDPLWDGCHDFGPLSAREAARTAKKAVYAGPMRDELGTFATLISRFWRRGPGADGYLRAAGEGGILDLVQELEAGGEVPRLAAMEVHEAFASLRPRLREIA
jgi:tRNA(Arg) A34 adenosine deaminase TadA